MNATEEEFTPEEMIEQAEIYDSGEGSADRYFIIFPDEDCLSLSSDGDSPQGVSLWGDSSSYVRGPHLGIRIAFRDLPENLKIYIERSLDIKNWG